MQTKEAAPNARFSDRLSATVLRASWCQCAHKYWHLSHRNYHVEHIEVGCSCPFSSERTKPRRASVFLLTALPLHIALTHFGAFTIYFLPFLAGVLWTNIPCPMCVSVCMCQRPTLLSIVYSFLIVYGVINFYLPSFYVNTVTMAWPCIGGIVRAGRILEPI